MVRMVIGDATPQGDIVVSCNHIEGIHLHALDGPDGLQNACFPVPATPWPQALAPQHNPARRCL